MAHRTLHLLVVHLAALLLCVSGAPAMMGYQEGTRRIVACNSGFLTGVAVQYENNGEYEEPIITALRLLCSRNVLGIEWLGERPDSFTFGRMHQVSAKAECASGVKGLKWRNAPMHAEGNAEWRLAGVKLECKDGTSSVADSATGKDYSATFSMDCSTDGHILTSLHMWYTFKHFSGAQMGNCTSPL